MNGGKIIVMLGFAILLPLLIFAGYASISAAPKSQDFVHPTAITPGVKLSPEELKARAATIQEQTNQFNIVMDKYAVRFLMVTTAIGTAAIIGGAYAALPGISSGLIIAGILTIIWSNLAYYAFSPSILHFASYLMGFLGVLLVAIRMMRKTEKPSSQASL